MGLVEPSLQGYARAGLLEGGKPRLEAARSYFLCLRDLDFKGLVDYFNTWRSYQEYLVLQKQEGFLGLEKTTIAVKCSKRGNDVYWSRVSRRLGALRDLKDVEFFNPRDRGRKTTRAVFATLTWDPKMGSIEEAWQDQGSWWNRWITNLREKYGRISYLRTWESFVNGYPHVHVLLLFEDYEFRVFRSVGKDGKVRWRLEAKAEFEAGWPAYVDVQGCSSFQKARVYITKYLTKTYHERSEEALDRSLRGLTLAMNWVFRKRSFAISRDLVDLIVSLRNSKSGGFQATLDGGKVPVIWVCLGVHSAEELKIEGNPWAVRLGVDQFEADW